MRRHKQRQATPCAATRCIALLVGLACAACGKGEAPPPTPQAVTSEPIMSEGSPPQEDAAIAWRSVRSADGGFVVRWMAEPDPIPTADPFVIRFEVWTDESATTPLDGGVLSVDASMPHHGHGMNVRPIVTRLGPGRYRAAGMLMHMPGRWELTFDRTSAGVTERAQTTVMLGGSAAPVSGPKGEAASGDGRGDGTKR